MSNLTKSFTTTTERGESASSVPQHLLGHFPTYAGAERVVDQLSDNGFAVEHSRIVGNGLRSVEYVTGRVTTAGAAQAGAASGAWFGLLFGLLLGLFHSGYMWVVVLLVSAGIGSLWGAVFGYMAHRATRGRDFTSVKGIEAEEYSVYVDAARADEAVRLAGLL